MTTRETDRSGRAAPPVSQHRFPALRRLRARVRRNRALNLCWRAGILTLGVGVVLAGIVMLVAPGPGMAGIVVGLAILATEFTWAHHLLHRARVAARRARTAALDPARRRRNVILGTIVSVVVVAAVTAYLWRFGFVLPFSLPWSG